jgi:hypothetical protein
VRKNHFLAVSLKGRDFRRVDKTNEMNRALQAAEKLCVAGFVTRA